MNADLVPVQKDMVSSTGKAFKRTYWVSAAEAKQLVAEGKAKPVGAAPIGFKGTDWHALTDEQKVSKWKQYDAAFKAAATKNVAKAEKMIAAGDPDGAQELIEGKLGEIRDGMGDELFGKMSAWAGQFDDAATAQANIAKLASHPLGAAMAQVYGKKWTDVANTMVQYGGVAEKIPGSVQMFGKGPSAELEPAPEKPATSVAMSEKEAKQGIDHVVMAEFGGDHVAALAALNGPEGDKAAGFFQKALGPDWKQKVNDHIKEKFGANKGALDKVIKSSEKLKAATDKAAAAKQKWMDIKAKNEAEGIKSKAAEEMPPPTSSQVAPSAVTETEAKGTIPDSGFTPTGEAAGGSQGGKWYKDASGQKYFGKDYKGDMERLATEHVANGIYNALGISSPETKIVDINGKQTIMSKAIDGKPAGGAAALAGKAEAGFVADAFMGNWDVVGQTYDNMLIDKNGEAHRIDNGGTLFYRAQGGKKDFGPEVKEMTSMRDPKINPTAAKVFGKLTDEQIKEQASSFVQKYEEKRDEIHKLVDDSPMSESSKAKVKAALDARAKYIKDNWTNPKTQAAEPEPKGLAGDGDGDGKAGEDAEAKPSMTTDELDDAVEKLDSAVPGKLTHESFEKHLAAMPPHIGAAMKKAFGDDWHEKVKAHLEDDPTTLSPSVAETAGMPDPHQDPEEPEDDVAKALQDTHDKNAAIIEMAMADEKDPVEALVNKGFHPVTAKNMVKNYEQAGIAAPSLHEEHGAADTGEIPKENDNTLSPEEIADHASLHIDEVNLIEAAISPDGSGNPEADLKAKYGLSDAQASEAVDKYHAASASLAKTKMAMANVDEADEAGPELHSTYKGKLTEDEHEQIAESAGMSAKSVQSMPGSTIDASASSAPPMAELSNIANSTIMSAKNNGADPVQALVEKLGYDEATAKQMVAAKDFAVKSGIHTTKTVKEIHDAIKAGKDPAYELYTKYGMDPDKADELVAGYHATLKEHAAGLKGDGDGDGKVGEGAATGFDVKKHQLAVEKANLNKMDGITISNALQDGKDPQESLESNGLTPFTAKAIVDKYMKAGGLVPGKTAPVGSTSFAKYIEKEMASGSNPYLALTADKGMSKDEALAHLKSFAEAETTAPGPKKEVEKVIAKHGGKKWTDAGKKAAATKAAKKEAQQNFAKAEQELLESKNSLGSLGKVADVMSGTPGGLKTAKEWHQGNSKDIDPKFHETMAKEHGPDWHEKLGKHFDAVEKMQQAKAAMDATAPKKSKASPKKISEAKSKFIAEAQQAKAEATQEYKAANDFQSHVDMDGVSDQVHAQVEKIASTTGFEAAMKHLGVPDKAAAKMKAAIQSWTGSSNSAAALQMRGAAIKIMAGGDKEKEKQLLAHFEKAIDDHAGPHAGIAQKQSLHSGFNDPIIEKTLRAAAVVAQSQYRGKKTVTLYRGVSGKQAEQLKQNMKDGKPLVLGVHSMSCWSETDKVAKKFAASGKGIVLKIEVPVTSIVHSHRVKGTNMNSGFEEKEVVIASSGKLAVNVHK